MAFRPEKNQFFDINKFPKDWGLLVFPISMSRIGNTQSPQHCFEALEFLAEKIVATQVGANFIYTEGLYMNLEREVFETKNRFAATAASHMGAIRSLVNKHNKRFQIENAFHFDSWFQMYLSNHSFFQAQAVVKELYESDTEFQKMIEQDASQHGKPLTDRQIAFYLEEHTIIYLLIHDQLHLQNEYVNGRQQWLLFLYPGMPPKGQIYLTQQDPLKLMGKSHNPYKGQYDLLSKRFIDYRNVDLATYSFAV